MPDLSPALNRSAPVRPVQPPCPSHQRPGASGTLRRLTPQAKPAVLALLATLTLVAMPARAQPSPTVLLLQDVAPWGTTSNEQVLTAAGVGWRTLSPSRLRRSELGHYSVIVVASDQPQAFYDTLAPHLKALTRWLREGPRTLQFHGASNGWHVGSWMFALPGGRVHAGYGPDVINLVPRRQGNHPLVAGLFNRLDESQINTTVLLSEPPLPPSRVVMTNRDGQPTLIDYCLGAGRVIASGQQLEAGWAWGQELGRLLENMVAVSTGQPGCPQKP